MPANSMPLPAEHLDPETVAGFSAHTLNARERLLVFEHLAGCESCREWIAANAEISEAVVRHSPVLAWGLLAAAGVVLAWAGGWELRQPARPPLTLPASQPQIAVHLADSNNAVPVQMTRQRTLPAALRRVRLTPGRVPTPAANEISLRTTVGEKWIPASGFLEPAQARARVDLSERLRQAGTFRIRIVPAQSLAELNLRIGSQAVDQAR